MGIFKAAAFVPPRQVSGLPEINGDRFRPEDFVASYLALRSQHGDLLTLLFNGPSIINGMAVTKGTGDTLSIASGDCVVADDQVTSLTFHDKLSAPISPAFTVPAYLVLLSYSGGANLSITSAVLDGATVNYVKVKNFWSTVLQRIRPTDVTNTPYSFVVKDDMAFTVNTTPPVAGVDLELARFTGTAGGAFSIDLSHATLTSLNVPNNQITLQAGDLKFTQAGVQSAFNFLATQARTYHFPDHDVDVGTLPAWAANTNYRAFFLVSHNGVAMRRRSTGTSRASFDSAEASVWEALTGYGNSTGFPNLTDSSLSFDPSLGRVTLTRVNPLGIETWDQGKMRIIGSDVIHNAQAGGHYLMLENGADTFVTAASPDPYKRLVAYYYLNGLSPTRFIIDGEERHSAQRNPAAHLSHHLSIGMTVPDDPSISYSPSNPAAIQIGITGPVTAYDEDLVHTITHAASPGAPFEQILDYPAQIPPVYMGPDSLLVQDLVSTYPWKMGVSQIAYNPVSAGVGAQADVPNGKYVCYWLLVTNSRTLPIKMMQGRYVYDTPEAAIGEDFAQMGVDIPEVFVLRQFILKCDTSISANAFKMQIEAVVKPSRTPGSAKVFSAQAHNGLSDRDVSRAHPASAISLATISGIIATNIQAAVAELYSAILARAVGTINNSPSWSETSDAPSARATKEADDAISAEVASLTSEYFDYGVKVINPLSTISLQHAAIVQHVFQKNAGRTPWATNEFVRIDTSNALTMQTTNGEYGTIALPNDRVLVITSKASESFTAFEIDWQKGTVQQTHEVTFSPALPSTVSLFSCVGLADGSALLMAKSTHSYYYGLFYDYKNKQLSGGPWHYLASTPAGHIKASLLPDGTLLVVEAFSSTEYTLNIYNVANQTWTPAVVPSITVPVTGHMTLQGLPGGDVLMVMPGPNGSMRIYRYNYAYGTVSSLGDLTTSTLAYPCSITLMPNYKVKIVQANGGSWYRIWDFNYVTYALSATYEDIGVTTSSFQDAKILPNGKALIAGLTALNPQSIGVYLFDPTAHSVNHTWDMSVPCNNTSNLIKVKLIRSMSGHLTLVFADTQTSIKAIKIEGDWSPPNRYQFPVELALTGLLQ